MSSRSRNLTPIAVTQLTLDTEPYLSCDDCFEQVDAVVDALLSSSDSLPAGFRAHLLGCAACLEEARSLTELAAKDRSVDRDTALARLDRALA